MKQSFLLSLLCFSFFSVFAQTVGIKKMLTFSPPPLYSDGKIYDAKPTKDKGMIIVGVDSTWLNVIQALEDRHTTAPGFVAKLDSAGQTIWVTKFAARRTSITSVVVLQDGSMIICGHEKDVDEIFGGAWETNLNLDLMIAKLSPDGTILWKKLYGGSTPGFDQAFALTEAGDGNFLIAGSTTSNNGDVSGNHNTGTSDVWLLKVNGNGDILWKKCYGGSGDEFVYSVLHTEDNGFLLAGKTNSTEGDAFGNNGNNAWVFKIASDGTLQWQKNYGGDGTEALRSIAPTDNGYIIAGYSTSNNGTVSGNHGRVDGWLIRINETGNLIWSKSFGGSMEDQLVTLQRNVNGEYLAAGYTFSYDGDAAGPQGRKMWLISVDASGSLKWFKPVMSSPGAFATSIVLMEENLFWLVGYKDMTYLLYHDAMGLLVQMGKGSVIEGSVFLDANSNGTKDPGEIDYNDIKIVAARNGFEERAVPQNGKYRMVVDSAAYNVTPLLSNQYFQVSPAAVPVTFSSYFDTVRINFAVQPLPGRKDLVVSATAMTAARPGFDVEYLISYRNAGTTTETGTTVSFVKSPKLTLLSSIPAHSSVAGDTIKWNIGSISPLQTASIELKFNLAPPPTTSNSENLSVLALIGPMENDRTPDDNKSAVSQIVTGSFDPNDKAESHAGRITPSQVLGGDWLTYLIRFQNTGTDTAFNITVRDTLDTKLDWNSFEMIGASHLYNLQVTEKNVLAWRFNKILLVDSNRNEPLSHGYIAYRIKPKTNLLLGDEINNTASIYFDFNLPVVTNTEKTTVFALAALPATLGKFHAYVKRDRAVEVEWKTVTESGTDYFEVQRSKNGADFTTIGKVLSKKTSLGSSYALPDPSPLGGVSYYRLKTVDADGKISYSSVVKINLDEKQVIVTSLYPNPASQQLTVEVKGGIKGTATYVLYNSTGQQVINKNLGRIDADQLLIPLSVSHLSKGLYTLKLELAGKVYTERIIIQ